ncbi:MAG TPA: Grx4 family monothiol glutaredoxin [Polyangiaceae bacterium LLY-WYZ-15_(1-7)]|nr:Grx4 family monothiol glutaredoxin [Polyangiaceae bacterium LLY-WYZ-15_(1-7)]HJL10504.1 Grx4 family monothiol glutaredoxin [Polyangiaceae bacterium LLY-WYZ-15_(1-7)]HJL27258.1 Grx4 family monothiol glutaredoxin [Polyangiaceae bacterium LLY-WYZ-15_(1-7)]HJL37565.1 Grx4 family monothiol glutaredoxin [Polyangiaceae bacterium LLY-WYZ-15_(1-7)]
MAEAEMDPALRERIQGIVDAHPVVLFMKGSRLFPRCGFSATVVEVLKRSGVTAFHDVDVLKDPAIRQGIKEFTSWPTIPQLYVQGKFVGGCDIVRDLYESGELEEVLAPVKAADDAG